MPAPLVILSPSVMPAPPRHPRTPSVIPAHPPSSPHSLRHPLRHPCTPSVIPAPLRHPRTLPSSPHPSVMPAPPSSPPHSLRHPCTPSVIPAPPPSCLRPLVTPALPPSSLHPLRHPRTPPSSLHSSVIPAPFRHPRTPSVIPAPPPSSPHPSVIPAPPPSFLRRQESMRPPHARSRPRSSTAHRSTRRRGHPIGVSQRWSAVERRSPTRYPSERMDSCLAVIPASRSCLPPRHSCAGRNPCDHRTPVHAPGPRRPTEALGGAATRSGFRSDGAPSNVAVPLATPQSAWIPACAGIHAGGAGVTQGVGIIEGAREAAGRRTQHS